MNGKGKVVAELSDGKCLWDLALLCDISDQANDLNEIHQGQQKLIYDMKMTAFWDSELCSLIQMNQRFRGM
jgi:hypothetical protein